MIELVPGPLDLKDLKILELEAKIKIYEAELEHMRLMQKSLLASFDVIANFILKREAVMQGAFPNNNTPKPGGSSV